MKSFIDGCHHRKEEGLLFRALEEAGVPQLGGLMGEVLAEHDECRRLSLQVRAWAERLATGDLGSRAALAWNALAFVRLIRPHMTKEETALFPFADKRLPSALQEELAQRVRPPGGGVRGAGAVPALPQSRSQSALGGSERLRPSGGRQCRRRPQFLFSIHMLSKLYAEFDRVVVCSLANRRALLSARRGRHEEGAQ